MNPKIYAWILIILLIILLVLPIFQIVLMMSVIKTYSRVLCSAEAVLSVFLGGDTREAFKNFCESVRNQDAGTGSSHGFYSCPESDISLAELKTKLEPDEGIRKTPYKDTEGKCTIGVGHNLQGGNNEAFKEITGKEVGDFIVCCEDATQCNQSTTITDEQVGELLNIDMTSAISGTKSVIPFFNNLPKEARHILVEMYFQMGRSGLSKHEDMIKALSNNDWRQAAVEIIDSDRYDQLTCSSSGPKLSRQEAAEKIDSLSEDGCRVIKQAVRMRNAASTSPTCPMPVIPVSHGNNKCDLEKGPVADTYLNLEGTKKYDVYQNVIDTLRLVKIGDGDGVKTVGGRPLYIEMNVAEALRRASQSCDGCFVVTSAYRSCIHQGDIIESGQTNTLPGSSNHNGGYGVDLNGVSAEYECGFDRCSIKLVRIMKDFGLTNFNQCNDEKGDFFVTKPNSTYRPDCLHFSPNGR